MDPIRTLMAAFVPAEPASAPSPSSSADGDAPLRAFAAHLEESQAPPREDAAQDRAEPHADAAPPDHPGTAPAPGAADVARRRAAGLAAFAPIAPADASRAHAGRAQANGATDMPAAPPDAAAHPLAASASTAQPERARRAARQGTADGDVQGGPLARTEGESAGPTPRERPVQARRGAPQAGAARDKPAAPASQPAPQFLLLREAAAASPPVGAPAQAPAARSAAEGAPGAPGLAPAGGAASAETREGAFARDAGTQAARAPRPALPAHGPAPATPPPPLPPAAQLAPIVLRLIEAGGVPDRLVLALDPAELGRVEVRVAGLADAAAPLSVAVSAERAETLALLERDAALLDRALADAGLAERGITLSFGMQDGAGRRPRPERATQRGEERAPPDTAPRTSPPAPRQPPTHGRAALDIAI
ncbi:MAG: flagellar hook-length control protein FliK [Alphaproteobacteria bacterium]|nr:flagellar hook-length control protein FliK [Alphaproteobacteria bacterium]